MTFAQPFSNYEILARIGSGAMGTVFKARQKHMNRIVALKVLKPSLARDARYVERLQREARIVGKLNHPNVVTGYDLGQEGGYHFFVMEFVEGHSLRELLHEWGIFPEEQVLDVAIQVTDALAHAFECGVIHRDVKPGNILIDAEGRVKLTDMGLAKVETDLALTREGATVGTPQYISPEQARDPVNADVRSDLYSLGATLFHMATGQPPFRAESIGELITKVLQERAPSAIDLNPALSDGLSLVIRKLLAKDPVLRYQTPRELLADLRRVQRAERPAVDPRALDEQEPAPQVRPRPRHRRSRVWLVGAVGGVVALCVALWSVLWRGDGSSSNGSGTVTLDVLRLELHQQLAAQDSFRARFEILRERGVRARDGEVVAMLAEEERRVALEMGSALRSAIDEWSTTRLGEADAFLREPAHWRDAGSLVREKVAPELERRFGYPPDQLPTAELRGDVAAALARLDEALAPRCAQRDEEFLRRHERFLRDELREEVLELARRGEFRDALVRLHDGFDGFFGREGRPERAQLPDALRVRVIEAEENAERAVSGEVRDAQRTIARAIEAEVDRALEGIARLREDVLERGGSPAPLRRALDALAAGLPLRYPSAETLAAAAPDPWPEVEARLRAARAELEALEDRFADQVLEEVLDLAYRVLVDDGPAAALRTIEAVGSIPAGVDARRAGHRAALAAAADLAERLCESAPGARLPLSDGTVATVVATAGGHELRDPTGVAVPFRRVDVAAALTAAPASLRAAVARDAGPRLGRAVLAMAAGDPSRAVALVESDGLRFLEEQVWPRLNRRAEAVAPGLETSARAEVEAMLRARDAGDVDGVRRGLEAIAQRFESTRVAADTTRLRAEVEEWLRAREARAALEASVRARVPAAFAVAVGADGEVRIAGPVAALTSLQEPWRSRGDHVAWSGGDGQHEAALELPSPLAAPSSVDVGIEVRLADQGQEPQLAVLTLNGVAVALVVLPGGRVAAAVLDRPEVADRPDDLRRALADPIAEAVETTPLLVPGVWHRILVRVERRRGSGADVAVRVDGPDGRRVASGRSSVWQEADRWRMVVHQPTDVRSFEVRAVP